MRPWSLVLHSFLAIVPVLFGWPTTLFFSLVGPAPPTVVFFWPALDLHFPCRLVGTSVEFPSLRVVWLSLLKNNSNLKVVR